MFITKDAVKEVSNKSGLSCRLVFNSEDYEGIMGGDSTSPMWSEYLRYWKVKYRPHIRLLRKFIIENGLIGTTGEDQNHWTFKFSDGVHLGFSWRAWGDLMQAIVNKKEGYMAYYM